MASYYNMVSFLVLMESLEEPPETMPGVVPEVVEVGVEASRRPPIEAPQPTAADEEAGLGEGTESAPEEEEEERRRCLSDPTATPPLDDGAD